ncbi:hypothetical protein C2845_PM03G23390 [Panicum miliaceum]|uniref:Uncharacterized protein n=1 Tax=Panicum miliaceum TaxID=4540 RepID=A0A3L6TCB0_PANMI|nr:hypothetical protein C2845_PM03G23390 [Panicum miliaceum]
MLLRLDEVPVVVASSSAAAREVTKTHDLAFATRPISTTTRLALAEGSEGLINAPLRRALEAAPQGLHPGAPQSAPPAGTRPPGSSRPWRQLAAEPDLGALISSCVADVTARAIIGRGFRPSLPDLYPSSRLAMLVSRGPRQMKWLRAEVVAFMDTIIQEHQLAPERRRQGGGLGRRATENPEGRDPMHWEFVPERFESKHVDFKGTDFEYLLFGAGRRMCPGLMFGLANMELVLAYHFDWELPRGMMADDMDMAEVMGVTARRKADLLLVPVVRVPLRLGDQ